MDCPKCGVWTRVIETRGVRRVRECANLHRFTTEEVFKYDHSEKKKADSSKSLEIALAKGSYEEVAARYSVSYFQVHYYRDKQEIS